jgi:hypothetical protein
MLDPWNYKLARLRDASMSPPKRRSLATGGETRGSTATDTALAGGLAADQTLLSSTKSSAPAASPAPTRFSRLRRQPSTRATPEQLRAIFDVPHKPLPLETVAGGGAFGKVYLVETSMGRIAVKQVCDTGGPSAGGSR